MLQRHRSAGFTLIEIVLVLAVGAFILIVVFMAVSTTQRSRRDAQRQRDIPALSGFALQFAAAHGNVIPANQGQLDAMASQYFTDRHDPLTGSAYTMVFRDATQSHSDRPPVGTIYYQLGHWCNRGPQSNPDSPEDPIAGASHDLSLFALWTSYEVGGTSVICADNK